MIFFLYSTTINTYIRWCDSFTNNVWCFCLLETRRGGVYSGENLIHLRIKDLFILRYPCLIERFWGSLPQRRRKIHCVIRNIQKEDVHNNPLQIYSYMKITFIKLSPPCKEVYFKLCILEWEFMGFLYS